MCSPRCHEFLCISAVLGNIQRKRDRGNPFVPFLRIHPVWSESPASWEEVVIRVLIPGHHSLLPDRILISISCRSIVYMMLLSSLEEALNSDHHTPRIILLEDTILKNYLLFVNVRHAPSPITSESSTCVSGPWTLL